MLIDDELGGPTASLFLSNYCRAGMQISPSIFQHLSIFSHCVSDHCCIRAEIQGCHSALLPIFVPVAPCCTAMKKLAADHIAFSS